MLRFQSYHPSCNDITTEECRDLSRILKSKSRWLSFLHRSGCEVPFLRPEWYISALKTINSTSSPCLLFLSSLGQDIALAPLIVLHERYMGLRITRLTFVHNSYTPFQGILSIQRFSRILESTAAYGRLAHGPLCFLDLNELRPACDVAESVSDLPFPQSVIIRIIESHESRYLKLDQPFELKLASLDKKTQHEFRRKLQRINKVGQCRLVRFERREDVEVELTRFFEMYERTWKGPEPNPDFYKELCNEFSCLRHLYFYGLLVGQRVVAYVICLRGGSVMYGLKTTYDPNLKAYSPGIILFYRVIEDLYRTPGIEEFDIGRGNEQYKREWASLTHKQMRIVVMPRNPFWKFIARLKFRVS